MYSVLEFINNPLILLFISSIFALYWHFDSKAKYWQKRGVNGPKPLPLFGNLLDNFRMPQNVLEDHRLQKYGKVYGSMYGTKPVITVGEPELIKQIMITDFHAFMDHRDNFPGDPFLGRMLLELRGDEWRRVRALMSPAFTTGKLKAMQPLIEQCIQQSFNCFNRIADNNEEFDIKRMTLAYTLDVIARCVFGANTNVAENPNDVFVVNAHDLATFRLWRMLSCLFVPCKIQMKYDMQLLPARHVKYFSTILLDVIKKRKESKQDKVDFVTLMLNAEQENDSVNNEKHFNNRRVKLSEDEIISNCLQFFMAGMETTATFIQFTLYALAMNPQIQEKVYKEISEYFKKYKRAHPDSLNTLAYFDALCNESLRMYSPITVFDHICCHDYKLGDITIEKGVILNLPIYAVHHDQDLFPDPHEFIPERFLPENKDNIKPYSFIPFSLGQRMCVGSRFSNFHSKLFLANFINTFEVIKITNTPEKPEYNGRYILLCCKPMFATVRRRQ